MRGFIAILVIVAISVVQTAVPENYNDFDQVLAKNINFTSLNVDKVLAKLLVAEFQKNIRNTVGDYGIETESNTRLNESGITATLNEFADKICANIGPFVLKNKLEPIKLENLSADVLLASVKLTQGSLHGLATIKRYEDVTANYVHNTKVLTVTLPIKFVELGFLYNYEVHVIGIGPKGTLEGKIKDFKFYLQFALDIPNLTVTIKQLKTTNSGHISVEVHGNITDFIFNIISEVVTTILHPLIQGVLEGIIKLVASNVVKEINSALYNITHPDRANVTQFAQYVLN